MNKKHVGDTINSLFLSFVERLSSSQRLFLKLSSYIVKVIFWTLSSVSCREVFYTISSSWRVPYQRFHSIVTVKIYRISTQAKLYLSKAIILYYMHYTHAYLTG